MQTIRSLFAVVAALSAIAVFAEGKLTIRLVPGDDPATARDKIRAYRAAHGGALPKDGVEVVFADGVYPLAAAFALDKRDSGTKEAPITYRAETKGGAVLSGALSGLKKTGETKEGLWRIEFPASLPRPLAGFTGGGLLRHASAAEEANFLFQDGRRLQLARSEGYLLTGEFVQQKGATNGVFRFKDAGRLAAWAKESDLWAHGLWQYEWSDLKSRIVKVDAVGGTVEVDGLENQFGWKTGAKFYVLNAASEIDRPGEWALDRQTGVALVKPIEGAKGPVVALGTRTLLQAKDVSNVVFEGLVFEYARGTAVSLDGCVDSTIRSCCVRHTGGGGIQGYGQGLRIVGCDVTDVGQAGITVGGGDMAELVPAGNVVENNHVSWYGRVTPNYRPGIGLSGCGNRAVQNLVHHSDHIGINFGGNDHLVASNVIHDVCRYNDDAGAIYCCERNWTRRGTVIEGNWIRMVGDPKRHSMCDGIYLDDYSSGITVRGNIVDRSNKGVHVGGGQDVTVEGNLFLSCGPAVWHGDRGTNSFANGTANQGKGSMVFKPLEEGLSRYASEKWRKHYPNLLRVYDFADPKFAHGSFFCRFYDNVAIACCGLFTDSWGNCGEHARDVAPYTSVHGNVELMAGDPSVAGQLARFETVRRTAGLVASADRFSPAVKFGADAIVPPLHPFYDRASVGVHLLLDDAFAVGAAGFATDMRNCHAPGWAAGRRVVSSGFVNWGLARTEWTDYTLSFTPAFDCRVTLELRGQRGAKTAFDAVKADGATLANGSFEEDGGWNVNGVPKGDFRFRMTDLEKPYGLVTASEVGLEAVEGRRVGVGNDVIVLGQRLNLRKGVPVRISFKARAVPYDYKRQ